MTEDKCPKCGNQQKLFATAFGPMVPAEFDKVINISPEEKEESLTFFLYRFAERVLEQTGQKANIGHGSMNNLLFREILDMIHDVLDQRLGNLERKACKEDV